MAETETMIQKKNLKHETIIGLNQWATDLVEDLILGEPRKVVAEQLVEQEGVLVERQTSVGNYAFFLPKKSDVIVDLTDILLGGKKEEYGSYQGAGGDFFPLHKYTLHDGRVYYEAEQEDVPWLRQPLVFFVLKFGHPNGPLVGASTWTKEEALRAGHI